MTSILTSAVSEKWSFHYFIQSMANNPHKRWLHAQAILNRHTGSVQEWVAHHEIPIQTNSFLLDDAATSVLLTSDISGIDDITDLVFSVHLIIIDVAHVAINVVRSPAEPFPDPALIRTDIFPELYVISIQWGQ